MGTTWCLPQGLDEREAITVIVVDSHSVWSQHRHNLVAVERYIYFPSSRASLGLKGPSLLDANRCGVGCKNTSAGLACACLPTRAPACPPALC